MKFGTIGTGYIVHAFLDGVYQSGSHLAAVYSRSKEKGSAFANHYQVTKVYTDLADLLIDDEVEVVYIASPNSLHYAQTMQALKAGKHVVVEKPMCSTVKECEAMIALAKDQGLFLFEAITNQHLPNYAYVKSVLPKLGRVRMVQCAFSQYSSRYDALCRGETPNVFNLDFSGGALYDINVYNIHFVVGLFGEPLDVHYYCNKHPNGIDLSGTLILTYPDFIAVCIGAKDCQGTNFVQVQGEKGYAYVHGSASGCSKVSLHLGNDDEAVFNEQPISNVLYYENVDFEKIIESKDYAKRDALLEESLTCMKVLNQAREDAKIVFGADGV